MNRDTTRDDETTVDFGDLEELWAERARRVAELRRRADPTGMTRPRRDPDEHAWLAERGRLGPFVEVEEPTR